MDVIKAFFRDTERNKLSAENLVSKLKKFPYGIRNGVLPLYIGVAISELNGDLILYNGSREVDLNADNINKLIAQPNNYYLNLKKGSNKKTKFLNDLLAVFGLVSANNFKQDMDIAIKYLQKMVMNQPQIIRCLNSIHEIFNSLNKDDEQHSLKYTEALDAINCFIEQLSDENEKIHFAPFYRFFKTHWNDLKDSMYTFEALSDLASMQKGWRNTSESRYTLTKCLRDLADNWSNELE